MLLCVYIYIYAHMCIYIYIYMCMGIYIYLCFSLLLIDSLLLRFGVLCCYCVVDVGSCVVRCVLFM